MPATNADSSSTVTTDSSTTVTTGNSATITTGIPAATTNMSEATVNQFEVAAVLLYRYLRVEVLSLSLRPGLRAVTIFWLSQIIVFAYGLTYALLWASPTELGIERSQAILRNLSLESVGYYVPLSVTLYGAPTLIILGALAAAGDYRWGTIRTIIARVPGRASFILARFAAVALICFVVAATSILVGIGASLVISAITEAPVVLNIYGLIAGIGAIWLSSFAYAAFGMALGFVFRNALTSSVVALVWVIGVETLVVGILSGVVPVLGYFHQILLSTNVGVVAGAIDTRGLVFTQGIPGVSSVNSGPVACLILLVWIVGSIGVSLVSFLKRDLTD